MKKSELIFNVLLVPLDFVAIILAGLLSYYLRFNTDFLTTAFPVGLELPFDEFLVILVIVALLFMAFMALNRLYVQKNTRRIFGESFKVFVSISSASLTAIIILFFSQQFDASRFMVLAVWVLSIVFVVTERIALKLIQRALFKRGKYTRKIVLIGENHTTNELKQTYEKVKRLGYTVVDVIPSMDIEHTLQRLRQIRNSSVIDELVQANPAFSSEDSERLIDYCYEYHIDFHYVPNNFETHATNISIRTLAGIPIIELKKTPLEGWGRVAKRILDIIGGLVGTIIFGIPMLIIALAIRLDDHAPAIYDNERINHKGEKFYVYKFRSYKPEYCTGDKWGGKKASEEEDKLIATSNTRKGPLHKIDQSKDYRLTRLGPFIRKTSLDELPQFINVLKGDLSLVGPRAHMPKEVAKYEQHHKRVLTVKPGVTGLPQVNGRSDLDFEEEVKLDMYYIENWSLFMDLKILFQTPMALLKGRKTG